MSRKTELAKNTAILTVGKLCTQCISFFLLPLYTAILSTEEYGTFDLLVTYSTLLLPLVNWQLDQGLFRFMLDHRGNKEEQGKLFSTLLLSSTVQSVVYIILFICVEPFLKIENAYFLLLYVVLSVYTALFLQFVRGLGYSVKYTIASFISASATTVLNVIALVFLKMGLQGLFMSTLVAQFLTLLHMTIRKSVIIGSVFIGTMLIGSYYCGNKTIQFVALCITAIYAIMTNVDMLKSGVNLVKNRFGK